MLGLKRLHEFLEVTAAQLHSVISNAKSDVAAIETRFLEIKKIVGTSSGGQNLAFMTAPSSSSINDANTASSQVSAASPSVNTVSVHSKNFGLKWQLSLLSVRAKKYYQKTDKKIFINGNNIAGYDKSKKQYDDLLAKQLQTKFESATYKRGLDTVEAQLVTYTKNEIVVAVPPPHPLIYNRPNKLDLSYSGLDEFKEPEFKGYGLENNKKKSNVVKESDNSKENSDKSLVKEQESQVKSSFVEGYGSNTSKRVSELEPKKVRENNDAPIIEDWVSDDEEQDESMTKPVKKIVIPTAAKIEKPFKKSVRYAEMYRSQRPRGNQRNWNGQKSNQLVRPRIVNTARSYRTPVNTVWPRVVNTARSNRTSVNAARANRFNAGKPQHDDKGFVDSGCSRHMTSNIAYLSDFKEFDRGYVAFRGGAYGGKISGKGTLKTANLDFEDGKFDGKSDEGFFVRYSLSSKDFRVYNTRTKRVEENLHIGFLDNKPMIEGTSPKWLFDIDTLTQSMNYVPVSADTVSNISVGTSEVNSQECIDEDGLNNENTEQERFSDDSSSKDVNAVGQQVNTASLDLNTGSLKLNVVGPSVSTASPNEEDSTEEEPEVDLGNITNSYIVPTTLNTRIHKDHLIDNVIGEVLKPTSEQGFLSDVYEQKTNDTLNTYLYACFLLQIEPTSIAKALSDSSWVEAMQEELLQFKL
ncbi:hypothetical protein Tco_0484423 [Tanacetum coccineum]